MRYLLLLLLISNYVLADVLDVKINPKEPVFNESFEVIFTITSNSDSDKEPIINFDPIGIDVVGKEGPSVATRTSFINGKMSFQRTLTYKYEMVAPRSGYAFLRKINVEFGSKKITHPNINIRILQKARKPREIFVKAEVSKDQYYVGESILVRYYLYNSQRISLSSTDVKRFPKLDKFLKRFHQEKSIPQRVNVDGEIYVRRVIYTAQLFANDPGNYFIDPLSLSVTFNDRNRNMNHFGIFSGRLKKRSLRSKQLKLNIIPVPSENMPANYTGLVGKHDFNFKMNKSKFLANEPIEVELTVQGEGALELFEAPKIIADPSVEEFETSADLKINANFSANKKFEYTYLGRGDVKLAPEMMGFSYFDVESETFKQVEINFPGVQIVGVGSTVPQITKIETQDTKTSEKISPVIEKKPVITFKPLYKTINSFIYYSKHLFILVGCLLIIFLGFLAIKQLQAYRNRKVDIFEQIYRDGLTYSKLYKVISLLGNEGGMIALINDSSLDTNTKKYFIELIEMINAKYRGENPKEKFKIKKKYFQELERYIKSNKHEEDYISNRV